MDSHEILIIVFIVLGLLLCVYLFMTERKVANAPKELYNDIENQLNEKPDSTVPRVYEMVYYRKTSDSSGAEVWQIPRSMGNNNDILADVRDNRVNHMMVNGRLYKIGLSSVDKDYIYLDAKSECNSSIAFIPCGNEGVSTNRLYLVLHVLGYYF